MFRILARILVWTAWTVRFIAPHVFRFIGYCLMLAATSLWSMWRGFPTTVRSMAETWTDRAILEGEVPSAYARHLYFTFAVAAFITVIAGWVILSHITVWLFGVIF